MPNSQKTGKISLLCYKAKEDRQVLFSFFCFCFFFLVLRQESLSVQYGEENNIFAL